MSDCRLSWERYPVLGICGFSGAGKTTLLVQLIPELKARGLRVAVLKHDVHGIELDSPGKDSDILFRAGADVLLEGPAEAFSRLHVDDQLDFDEVLGERVACYDLVLVEGHKGTPISKLWLLSEQEMQAPESISAVVDCLPRDNTRLAKALAFIDDWLPGQWVKAPVYGCVLIGGESRRMGYPKHLLETGQGTTWLDKTVQAVSPHVERVVVAGKGDLPSSMSEITRLSDVPGVHGPLAGILAARRWAPLVSWLVCACDMPDIHPAGVAWLRSQSTPGRWAVLPKLASNAAIEPTLAFYDFRLGNILERLARSAAVSLQPLARHARVFTPTPPKRFCAAWRNVNSRNEL